MRFAVAIVALAAALAAVAACDLDEHFKCMEGAASKIAQCEAPNCACLYNRDVHSCYTSTHCDKTGPITEGFEAVQQDVDATCGHHD
ncbi:hypothetical protein GQ42DRAFT_165074 [Ramicandelaber brevisporus]|nr:hypothetical protein GQ42DRAFT_165074 [Ramicandelaber brevisporus]